MNQERAIFSRRDKLQHLVQPGESSLVLAVGGPWSLGGCPRSYLPLLGLGPGMGHLEKRKQEVVTSALTFNMSRMWTLQNKYIYSKGIIKLGEQSNQPETQPNVAR